MTHYITHLERAIKENWDKNGLSNYKGKSYTYSEIGTTIKKLHIIFDKQGIKRGDKIALCAKNTSNWCMAFLAITSYGAVAVPILNDFLPDSVQHLTDHSDSILLFTEKSTWGKLEKEKMPNLKGAIAIEDYSSLYSADGLLDDATSNIERYFSEAYANGLTPDDIHFEAGGLDDLTIISYTSGTTSSPKGVMLSARSISSNREFSVKGVPNKPGETVVSMLPLAHLYGLAIELIYPITSGCHVYLLGKAPSPALLLQALAEVKPYMIVTVPLVLEKIIKSKIFPVIDKWHMKLLLSIPGVNTIIWSNIRKKLMGAFGGNTREIILGGAAIAEQVENVLKKIRLPYTIGYGMTECGPLVGYEDASKFKIRSCGKIVDRMSVRIDSENPQKVVGEIQLKGDNVTMGYFKNPEATKASFTEDGWLKTGDLGLIDKEGNIFIKGRAKNMILTSNGQNIFPEEIEDKVNCLPYVIDSIVVCREGKIVALVYPDHESLKESQVDIETFSADILAKANLLLPNYSKISKIDIQVTDFERTPKRSIKRFLYK